MPEEIQTEPIPDPNIITDPVIQSFVSLRLRTCADQWSRSYSDAKRMLIEWQVKGFDTDIADDADVKIALGLGTRPITGREAHDIIRTCQIIVAFCERAHPAFGGRTPLPSIIKVATHGAYA
jgi:hypothetical protein